MRWFKEELDIVLNLIKSGKSYKEIEFIVNRTSDSIRNKVNEFGEKSSIYEKENKIEYICLYCNSHFIDKITNKRKFCNRSCAAKYNNAHKTTGTRRSKMEIWVEEQLESEYEFEIIFNGKEVINSELDIYIPHLKLAFELNGIFHYEPIYGENKLENVKNNDNRKFQACLEKSIELCIIDISGSIHFKPERDKKYLDIIKNIINNKLAE